jgi:hypothetical protein
MSFEISSLFFASTAFAFASSFSQAAISDSFSPFERVLSLLMPAIAD